MIFIIDHEHFVNAYIQGEKAICLLDRIRRHVLFLNCDELLARGHHLRNFLGLVTVFNEITREQAGELARFLDHGKGAEIETLLVDHRQHFADIRIRGNGDGILNEAVDVAFNASDFFDLVRSG